MKSLPMVLIVASVSTTVYAAAPAMTVGTLETKLSQEDCLAHGAKIMRSAGLTKNFETVGHTVYGETGDYTAAIRCESSKEYVVFIVAGPTSNRTEEIHKKLKTSFGEN